MTGRRRSMKRGILAIGAMLWAGAAQAQAQAPAPTVISHFSVTPVPFDVARAATEQSSGGPVVVHSQVNPAAPPEIVEMARAVKNDPELIYQHVHDNIEFS